MAAELVEPQEEQQNPDDEALTPEQFEESLKEEAQQRTEETSQEDQGDEIPDKYRGKSLKEIIAMHQEAEKVIGRHSGEVGELRQLVDTFIQGQVQGTPGAATGQNAQAQAQEEAEEIDFFEDPDRAIGQAIEKHPAVQKATEASERYERQTAAQRLQAAHPDAQEVIANPQFVEWVKSSPIRIELFTRADKQFDFDAANELLSSFKEKSKVTKEAVESQKADRKEQLRQASTGNAKGSGAKSGKRVLRRADIIRLMRDNPQRYEELADEIQLAYAENRVR